MIKPDSQDSEVLEKPFANPVLIYGNSIIELFLALYKQNKYLPMLQFTSEKSRNRFGDSRILGFYSNMIFGYKLGKLTSAQKIDELNYVLTYNNSHINATRRKKEFKVSIENDFAKIILTSFEINLDLK